MATIAFYPGSFDPVTLGHYDIIRRGAALFDRLVIGVGTHPGKQPSFSGRQRVDMIERCCADLNTRADVNISVVTYNTLTTQAVHKCGASVILRGLRNSSDFAYEDQMAGTNKVLANSIETVFLASSSEVRHISATLVRQIASMGGDVSPFVPQRVVKEITRHFL